MRPRPNAKGPGGQARELLKGGVAPGADLRIAPALGRSGPARTSLSNAVGLWIAKVPVKMRSLHTLRAAMLRTQISREIR